MRSSWVRLISKFGLRQEALAKSDHATLLIELRVKRITGQLVEGLFGAQEFLGETKILMRGEKGDALESSEDHLKNVCDGVGKLGGEPLEGL